MQRVRDAFFTTGVAAPDEITAAGLDPLLLDSWRRCLSFGVDPDKSVTVVRDEVNLDIPLSRVADTVITERMSQLEQSMSALSLTDADGTVLRQWRPDPSLSRWLEQRSIIPSVSADETAIGTTSAICLLNEQPTIIRGLEHFREDFAEVTSAGMPVIHPVTRKVIGSLNLTSQYNDSSPMMLPWLIELVRNIQDELQGAASPRERLLLNAYLAENRDARHPLIVLNEQTIITNAPAARLLTNMDQAMLWEHASRTINDKISLPISLTLANGTVVSVRCREVPDGGEAAGAVLSIRPIDEQKLDKHSTARSKKPELPGLVGKSPRWRALCRQATTFGDGPVFITGERGTGKAAVAKALAHGSQMVVLDAADAATDGQREWLLKVKSTFERKDDPAVLLRHCEHLPEAMSIAVANLIRLHRGGISSLFATATLPPEHSQLRSLSAMFPHILAVPPLADRLEDLPLLLKALSRRALDRLERPQTSVQWMPEAVQALSRLAWRGNIAALESIVFRTLQKNSNIYIGANDLPAEVIANASRRRLKGLERSEANAIIEALHDAGGNKHAAAQSLGIARSTLYRKIRSLGIDLSGSVY